VSKVERRTPRRPKKFRYQVLHAWLTQTYKPCRAADIGGGNGLLAYLLNQSEWSATVIDPWEGLALPWKYTDLNKKTVRLPEHADVPRVHAAFEKEMGQDYDLLVGLHSHGSCIKILQAAKEYGKDFVLIPCCVVDEPVIKTEGIHWTDSVYELAVSLGLEPKKVKLDFMGKDICIYSDRHSK
jgi:hypothetical protein